jgi:hypothetical protein
MKSVDDLKNEAIQKRQVIVAKGLQEAEEAIKDAMAKGQNQVLGLTSGWHFQDWAMPFIRAELEAAGYFVVVHTNVGASLKFDIHWRS